MVSLKWRWFCFFFLFTSLSSLLTSDLSRAEQLSLSVSLPFSTYCFSIDVLSRADRSEDALYSPSPAWCLCAYKAAASSVRVTGTAENVAHPIGITIPTYSFVSCSPDIQRVVMEIKHGARGQGNLGLFTVLSPSPSI